MYRTVKPCVTILIFTTFLCRTAFPQQPVHLQSVSCTVVNGHFVPARPVPDLKISLSYRDGTSPIMSSREVTNKEGKVILLVTPNASASDDLYVEIADSSGLDIYRPSGGRLTALSARLQIELLPKGSEALLDAPRIEELITYLLLQVDTLNRQNQRLRREVSQAKSAKLDFASALTIWARQKGFTPENVQRRVNQWIEDAQREGSHASLRQRELAFFANRQLDEAVAIGDQLIVSEGASMKVKDQNYLEGRRTDLRQQLSDAQLTANIASINGNYHHATELMQSVLSNATEHSNHFPQDNASKLIALSAAMAFDAATMQEGEEAPAKESLLLLTQSSQAFLALSAEYAAVKDPSNQAKAYNGLGRSLIQRGRRVNGDQSSDLISQAIAAYKRARELYVVQSDIGGEATEDANIGSAFDAQAELFDGAKSRELMEQSLDALKRADELTPSDKQLEKWVNIQHLIAITLQSQGAILPGPESLPALAQATRVLEGLLQKTLQAGDPSQVASVRFDLGRTYYLLGQRSDDKNSNANFKRSISEFEQAAQFLTKERAPQSWAAIQTRWADTLNEQSQQSEQVDAVTLLKEAVQHLHNALEICTEDGLPTNWADIQLTLGLVLNEQGVRTADPAEAITLYQQAAEADIAATRVFTKDAFPQDYGRLSVNLGMDVSDAARLVEGEQAVYFFKLSIQAFEEALTVFKKESLPQFWATTQMNLANSQSGYASISQGGDAIALLQAAITSHRKALEVFHEASFPQDWARTKFNLGHAEMKLGKLTTGEASKIAFADAIQDFESAGTVFTESAAPNLWRIISDNLTQARAAARANPTPNL